MSDQRTIEAFLDQLASDAPTPGGGSVAGLVAALAAALGSMVCALTRESADDERRTLATAEHSLRALRSRARALSERDERAYRAYIAATRLPKSTPEERQTRHQAVQTALHTTANVPLELAALSVALLASLVPVVQYGNAHLLSDARIAAMLAEVAHRAALVTARVNVALVKDHSLAAAMEAAAEASERRAREQFAEVERALTEQDAKTRTL